MATEIMTSRMSTPSLTQLTRRVCDILQQRRVRPRATYRIEFHPQQNRFEDVRKIIPYLAQLGISHLYASPLLKSFSGAPHGYATVDYSLLNPALGTSEEFEKLTATLREYEMGLILDIVPNHMSTAASENAWWNNVLEHGQSSPYAEFFDIDWQPAEKSLKNRVLLPILGEDFGKVLESGQLVLSYDQGKFSINYYDHHLPVDPSTSIDVLESLRQRMQAEQYPSEYLLELESILTALRHLPSRLTVDPGLSQERQRESTIVQSRLRILLENDPDFLHMLREILQEWNGHPGDSHSFDQLENLLQLQAYRLSAWKSACDEINYRRFFDINELAAICTEKLSVFQHTHSFILELLVRGEIQGLRIDHVDGLYDPEQYLGRLQWGYVQALGKHLWMLDEFAVPWEEIEAGFLTRMHDFLGGPDPLALLDIKTDSKSAPEKKNASRPWITSPPVYVVVEKILGPEEPLPASWPVAGTSGYDFLNLVNGLFVDPAGYARIRRSYQRFSGHRLSFDQEVRESKRVILDVSMSSELHLLAHRLKRLAEKNRHSRDFTLNSLIKALREIIVAFSVYRTYVSPETPRANQPCIGHASPRENLLPSEETHPARAHARAICSNRDKTIISRAVHSARRANPAMAAAIFQFIHDSLLNLPAEDADREQQELFLGRFQQVTSPVMAKGVEDTAFYRDVPLLSVNEVGSHPPTATVGLSQFHQENLFRQKHFPGAMLCSSTHDTKRSEDVRARINALTEIPEIWRTALGRWSRWNRHFRSEVHGETAPERNDEYLFYQTLIGIWPAKTIDTDEHAQLVQRIQQFMMKAIHEAKERTSWISPDADYEQAVEKFIHGTLREEPGNRFLQDLADMIQRIERGSLLSSLSAMVLKLTVPGVPDLYQGQEFWDDSLVDPDNRRPIDYSPRRETLREWTSSRNGELPLPFWSAMECWKNQPRDPRLKMFVLWKCLQLRKQFPPLFEAGEYCPLEVRGPNPEWICAFRRSLPKNRSGARLLVIVPRLCQQFLSHSQLDAACPPLSQNLAPSSLSVDSLRETTPNWQLEILPELSGNFQNVWTGESLSIEEGAFDLNSLLTEFPLGLLISTD